MKKSVWREVAAHLKSGHRKELYLKAVEKSKDVEELLEEAVADLPPRMRAVASGDFETALKLDRGEFCKNPSEVSYRDLMDAARIVGKEQEYHDKAFRFLESRKEYYLLTELALLEHRLDEAIGYRAGDCARRQECHVAYERMCAARAVKIVSAVSSGGDGSKSYSGRIARRTASSSASAIRR